MKPLVYMSGPITSNPTEHTHDACHIWESLRVEGFCTPICPHWSIIQDTVKPLCHERWIKYDLEIIARCDAILRLDGRSSGADEEVAEAKRLGIPVFETVGGLKQWCRSQTQEA